MANPDEERLASRKLASLLRSQIGEGVTYPVGAQLPTYRQLAADHGVAVNTAQAAVRLLQAEGLVEIRGTAGAYVRDQSDAQVSREEELQSELSDVRRQLQEAQQVLAKAEETVASLLDRPPTHQRRT